MNMDNILSVNIGILIALIVIFILIFFILIIILHKQDKLFNETDGQIIDRNFNELKNIMKKNIKDVLNSNNFSEYTITTYHNNSDDDYLEELRDKKPLITYVKDNKELQYFINANFCRDYEIDVNTNSILNPLLYQYKFRNGKLSKFILDKNIYCNTNSKTYPEDKNSKIYMSVTKNNELIFYAVSDDQEKQEKIMEEIQKYIIDQFEKLIIHNKYSCNI